MRRCLLIAFAMILSLGSTLQAQNIIIGDKAPDLRIKQWLMDMQPEAAAYTCVLFYHSESPLCRKHISSVKSIAKEVDGELNIVILTKEKYGKAGVTLTEHLDDHIGVAFDDEGRTFRSYGVRFIPFCVIYDAKRKVVWCGHAGSLNEKTIERVMNIKKQ